TTVNLPATQPLVIMGYNTPSLASIKKPWQAYALFFTAALLADGDSSRLVKSLTRDQQITVDVSANYNLLNRFDGLFTISAIPAKGQSVKDVIQAIQAQIKKLQTEQIGQTELARIKTLITADQIYRQDSLYGQAMLLATLIANDLPIDLYDQLDEKIEAVTAEQIQQVAQKFLTSQRLTIAELIPQSIES
ncbi:MAG: insulinase family protein, partial [Legionellales bacterium]|nr:insulinase family protein [Legionellales bacterium]